MRARSTFTLLVAAAVCAAAPRALRAQGTHIVTRAAQPSITLEDGAVVTAVFQITNLTSDSTVLSTKLDLPKGWTSVTGAAPRVLGPRGSDTWIVGVAVPSSAAAGRYVVRATTSCEHATTSDSVTIIIDERRSIELVPVSAPGWAVAGDGYEASFIVRNRGNVRARYMLGAATSRGGRALTSPASLALAPGASARVTVKVTGGPESRMTLDDVLELTVRDSADGAASAAASAHTTLVPDARSTQKFESVPTTLMVRSANGAGGVSPIVFGGSGSVGSTNTTVDFLVQTPTNQGSNIGFGEHREYRLAVQAPNYRVRLGDHLFGWSPLTMNSVISTGAELRATANGMEAGAYTAQPLWSGTSKREDAFFAGTRIDSTLRAGATFMQRDQGAAGTIRVGDLSASARLSGLMKLELSAARSDSAHVDDRALRARMSGSSTRFAYDAGVISAGDNFAGPLRGVHAVDGAVSAQLSSAFTAATSARVNEWNTGVTGLSQSHERVESRNATLSWRGALTGEYGRLVRRSEMNGLVQGGSQDAFRLTATRNIGRAVVALGAERGLVHDEIGASHWYTQGLVALNTQLGARGSFGLSSTLNRGNTLSGATDGVVDFGANARIRLPLSLELGFSGSARRATMGVLDSSGAWFSVYDARLDRRFTNGSVIGLHARTMQSPYAERGSATSAMYLEYRMPLSVPVIPSRERGRATGRVITADDGQPVIGALVRLGAYASVTDRNGRVQFSGLPAGHYRASLEAKGAAAGAMVVGDIVVEVHDDTRTPTTFALTVTRGAHITATIRRFERDGALGTADSLVSAGSVTAIVRLEGVRDTIFQEANDKGFVDFGNLAPGRYTLSMRAADAPDGFRIERERIDLVVSAGEAGNAEFRVIPKPRAIKILDGGAPIKITPPDRR